jgi:tetratricopeptide (TPR) repeat protein
MNIMGFGYANFVGQTPPRCVTNEPLERHIQNVDRYQNIVLARIIDFGPPQNPTTRSWVFYFYKGDVKPERRPDDILTFKIRTVAPGKIHVIDKSLEGPLSGAEWAKPLTAFPFREPVFVGGGARQSPAQRVVEALQKGEALANRGDLPAALKVFNEVVASSAPPAGKALALWLGTKVNEQRMQELFFPQGREGTGIDQTILMKFLLEKQGTPEATRFADLLWDILLDMKTAHEIVKHLPEHEAPDAMASFMNEYEDNEGFFELHAVFAEVPLPTDAQVRQRRAGQTIPRPSAAAALNADSMTSTPSDASTPLSTGRAGSSGRAQGLQDGPGWEELLQKGLEHVQQGKFTEAVSCWESAIGNDPTPVGRFDLHANIGAAHVDMLKVEIGRTSEQERDEPAFVKLRLRHCSKARENFLSALDIYDDLPSSARNEIVEQKRAQIMQLGPTVDNMWRGCHVLLRRPEPKDEMLFFEPIREIRRKRKNEEGKTLSPKAESTRVKPTPTATSPVVLNPPDTPPLPESTVDDDEPSWNRKGPSPLLMVAAILAVCLIAILATSRPWSGSQHNEGRLSLPDHGLDRSLPLAHLQQITIPRVQASSRLVGVCRDYRTQAAGDCGPMLAVDGDPKTAWCEGVEGDGVGQVLTFDLGDEYQVHSMRILSGYHKPGKYNAFDKNGAPTGLVIDAGGQRQESRLSPRMGQWEEVAIETQPLTQQVRLTISAVRAGPDHDSCISEVEFKGRLRILSYD